MSDSGLQFGSSLNVVSSACLVSDFSWTQQSSPVHRCNSLPNGSYWKTICRVKGCMFDLHLYSYIATLIFDFYLSSEGCGGGGGLGGRD